MSKRTSSSKQNPQHFWSKEGMDSYYGNRTSKKSSSSSSQNQIVGIDKNIFEGRSLPIGFLENNHLQDIFELFEFQGWTDFMEFHGPYNQDLIHQLFHNLIPSNNLFHYHDQKTKIFGDIYLITSESLSQHFFNQEKVEGLNIIGENFAEMDPSYDYARAIGSLIDPRCPNRTSNKVGDLSVSNRILFHILSHVIIPRGGSHTTLSKWDVGILYFIRNKVKISLPHLMITHMVRMTDKTISSCVYPMHLHDFFTKVFNVESEVSSLVTPILAKTSYETSLLQRLFLYDEASGNWVRRVDPYHQEPAQQNVGLAELSAKIDILNEQLLTIAQRQEEMFEKLVAMENHLRRTP